MIKTKKLWMLAAILVCGASVLTSCSSNDDNPAQPELNVQQLVGKWLYVEADGEVVETEESSITTYVMEGSTLKAYTSMSQQKYGLWACKQPTEVKIDGDKITLTMQVGDVTTVEEMTNITVSGDDLRYTCKYTVMKNGEVIDALRPYQLHCVKVHDDYSQIIIGRWEGTITSDEPGFVPQPFCEAYLADGKNIAYNLIDGRWVQEESEYDEYFVDGNLMITRWKLSGHDEERQNCMIESYADGTLIIKEVVVRNGKLYTETSTLTKVETDVWDEATKTLYVNTNPGKSAYEGRTDIVSVVFSDAVTSIGDRAFYNCPISVVDLPASVVSIGNEAFAGEDSDLDKVTIYATDCTFGEHPFLQSILTNIYVPAASLDAYKASYPGYKSQVYAIPEVELDGNEIIWSEDICEYIWVGIPYYHKDRIVAAHNTQGGITVNFAITDENSGFDIGCISLVKGEKLTFTSIVGSISHITIQAASYDDEDDEEDATPVAAGWTWDAAQHTFTWQGTPATAIEMLAVEDVNLESVQIQFTIE